MPGAGAPSGSRRSFGTSKSRSRGWNEPVHNPVLVEQLEAHDVQLVDQLPVDSQMIETGPPDTVPHL